MKYIKQNTTGLKIQQILYQQTFFSPNQIKRPRHSKFIRIILQGHVIYKLDTRSSSDVTIDQNGFTLRFSLPQAVMSMLGNYSITMDRGAVVGLGCTSDGPPTPGISSTKSWPFSVGVCSKGTFIADGYNCDGKITKYMQF